MPSKRDSVGLLMQRNSDEVIRASTQNLVEIIGLEDKIGTLGKDSVGDIGVFELDEGKYILMTVSEREWREQ